MRIRIGYELVYECPQPTPMILTLRVHPSRARDLVVADEIRTDPAVPITEYRDHFDNLCHRIVAPAGELSIFSEGVVADSGEPDAVVPSAIQHAVEELPSEALVFLLGSRYCEVDLLLETAWKLFENTPPGWARVQAICDFAHEHVVFGYEHARVSRTAREAHAEKLGVCRDFTHLGMALCRSLTIPARMVVGYLHGLEPMDLHAWFEAFVGGRWYTFDATQPSPKGGRIVIAYGRDAADVALATQFGPATLRSMAVWVTG